MNRLSKVCGLMKQKTRLLIQIRRLITPNPLVFQAEAQLFSECVLIFAKVTVFDLIAPSGH